MCVWKPSCGPDNLVFSNLCDVQQAVYFDFTVEVLARPCGWCRKHIERRVGYLLGQAPVQRPQKRSATLLTALDSSPSGDWSLCPARCQLSSQGCALPGTGRALPNSLGGVETRPEPLSTVFLHGKPGQRWMPSLARLFRRLTFLQVPGCLWCALRFYFSAF